MPLELHWFLPSHGDGRDLAEPARGGARPARITRRAPDVGYLAQVAQAADRLGFASVLTPAGLFCEDPWIVASALAAQTERLKFMIALRPGLVSPTLVAQMAATLHRVTGGRVLLNIVAGSDPDEQHRYGDWLDHDDRYARAEEFLAILNQLWSGRPVDHTGAHYRVRGALLARPPEAPPTVFLGGSSPAARQAAARHADVYLAWGETPALLGELLNRARDRAAEEGRTLRTGSRLHVISRDTAREAWAEAERLLAGVDQARIDAARKRFSRTESEGQRRAAALHAGGNARMEVHPNVWAGYSLVRPGAGAALVGSHEEVAERIAEYHAAGVDHLILSGQPHLEEAYWVGEGVLPLLRHDGLLAADAGRAPELAAR
ncbi:LLM class flavin-dependent oxidoreductase [Micromonospora sp. WMMC241]|uniref:LLM class flavin-dependent oxidoreductase n=1 Tax=Micromonospora sp. WMMC241 TaxID=3015159 RepID=UPI0022B6BBCA|nr:LLM class flavin-dependent oxidoreductase [Micromonospora sp. WMMC241]MCZ7437542.1 LLM class flavin-dependent oxidoreductase [Micromonospora sp. WMMC241]